MKVGLAIPCHINDKRIFLQCEESLKLLNPPPSLFSVDFNNGEGGSKKIVSGIFDYLFAQGCDVVLKCSADFYLSKHILQFVSSTEVVTFMPLARKPFDLTFALHRVFLHRRSWSGCYSISKSVWFRVRERFDGTDTSIMKAVGTWKVKSFQYQLLRPYREETTRKLLSGFPLWKRLLWQFIRMKAIKLND